MSLVGARPAALTAFQHAVGLGLAWLAMRWAQRAFGRRPAALAGLLLALDLKFGFHECVLRSETAAQLYFLGALWLALRARTDTRGGPGAWGAAGLCAALAGLTRGEFLLLGPLLGVFLALPGGAGRRGARWAAFALAWVLPLGAWAARNRAVTGYAGINLHGSTVLLDSVLPLVRDDLPTYPLAKRLLREEAAHEAQTRINARPAAWRRLETEHGYGYVQAGRELMAVAWEAVRTRPLRYAALVAGNVPGYLLPVPWLEENRHYRPVAEFIGAAGGPRAGFARLAGWDQSLGWAISLLALLSPLAWRRAGPDARWAMALLWAVYATLVLDMALVRAVVARYQAQLFLPLALLAALALSELWRRARGPIREVPGTSRITAAEAAR